MIWQKAVCHYTLEYRRPQVFLQETGNVPGGRTEFSRAAIAIGFGEAITLLFVAPLILLYSHTKKPRNKKISMLIPAVGTALILLLEGIYQGAGYLLFQRYNLVEMFQEVSGMVQTV